MGDLATKPYAIIRIEDCFEKEKSMLKQKCSIVITYLLLESETERGKCLTQSGIADALTRMGCICDRKTIGRDIKALTEMGCPIKKTAKGFYMDRKAISPDEAKFVIDCVAAADAPESVDKDALLARLPTALRHKYR